ncbi:hypothetical protein [Nitrobacter sp. TKz-YC01]|nr:hypothetical protein [Nitrobacter sp.]
MNKIIAIASFLALIGAPAALAQYGTKDGPSGLSIDGSSRYDAPIGHRQPRPIDLPPDSRDARDRDRLDPGDAALQRKIKSICRGC